MGSFLDHDVSNDASKALKSLIAHERKGKGDGHELIYLIINTEKPLAQKKVYIQRIVPIPHRLSKPSENSILLITKDPSTAYRKALTAKDSPTEDMFNSIISFKKLKSMARSFKNLKKMYHEYDLILADQRIIDQLPNILGEVFYRNHKKQPYMIKFSNSSSHNEAGDDCDAMFVKKQVRSICKFTSFIPSTDTSISIKIGHIDDETGDLVKNILSVVEFLNNPKFQPSGGIIRKNNCIRKMFVKTNESISLPIYEARSDDKPE